jgi:serine protease AprX
MSAFTTSRLPDAGSNLAAFTTFLRFAMTDNYTPDNPDDDYVASFSSAGPTVECFVKPDLLAPGGHILSYMQASTVIAEDHPEFRVADQYIQMSGTSQATGVVSGIVALLLLDEPNLTPDQVKYRLLSGSRPATYTSGSGAMVYPVFQQGAGLVDAYDVVHSDLTESANRNLDINADLAGISHYGGPVSAWESGNGKLTYYARDAQGNPMDGDGYLWNDSTAASVNAWVDQE